MSTLISRLTRHGALTCLTGAALALSATAMAGTPSADPFAPVPSVKVRYDDLNLASERGTTVLYQRITNAAKRVCPEEFSRDLTSVDVSRACQAKAIARAVQDVHSPKLALLHEAHVHAG